MKKDGAEQKKASRGSRISAVLLGAAVLLSFLMILQSRILGYVSIGGCSLFRVVTGSMEPAIPTGALLLTKRTAVEEIRPGDIICFRSGEKGTRDWIITHRVTAVLPGENGPMLETRGDANAAPDDGYVTEENLIGRVIWHTKEGNPVAAILGILTSGKGFLALIFLPCLMAAALLLGRSVRSLRREMDLLLQEAQKEERERQAKQKPELSPEELEELRQEAAAELSAQLAGEEPAEEPKPEEKQADGIPADAPKEI